MNKQSHTPGPWKVSPPNEHSSGWSIVENEYVYVAFVQDFKNSALIAAAPEMLEALTEISLFGTTRPMECGEGDDGDGHYKRIAYRLINIATKARAKAEGRE